MTNSKVAEKRFYKANWPSEQSRQEEINQVIRDWIFHDSMVAALGPKRGFFHVIERKQLERLLERYGAI